MAVLSKKQRKYQMGGPQSVCQYVSSTWN